MSNVHSSAVEVAQRVNAGRVLDRLQRLGSIGADSPSGVTRIAFSDADNEAIDVVAGWMRDAELTVAYDAFGNLFGSTDRNASNTRVSLAGSHLDTVRSGGRFDGALGVIGAIESVSVMQEFDLLPACPLEVVVWRCEEPVRFPKGKVGSSLFAGKLSIDTLRSDDGEFDLAVAINRSITAQRRSPSRRPSTYIELHIEQGRRLENAGKPIAVVSAVAAPTRLQIRVHGQADHSGATPMSDRTDALCAAAEMVLAIEQAARDEAVNESVATTANLTCGPGIINVIPGEVVMTVDVRGVDGDSIDRLLLSIRSASQKVGLTRNVRIDTHVLSRDQPTQLDARMINLLVATIRHLGFAPPVIPSGAGHDVQPLASLCPAGMLFVPSVNGISHSPNEYTRDDDLVDGVRALAGCWWRVAQEFRE